jgi:hypothetical protein
MSTKQEQRSDSEQPGEPVALKVYRGELCYKSQTDDQSFGMWCPVTQDLPFPEGTKFYTTPQPAPQRSEDTTQKKPLTDEQIEKMRHLIDWTAHWSYGKFARAIEAAHGIKENT